MKSPLQSLNHLGQSVWLEHFRRSLITSGELKRLIDDASLQGLTTDPSIFEQDIGDGANYRDILEAPESQGVDSTTLYEHIAVRDIQAAADLFGPVYERSRRREGYVSLSVSPRLAQDPQAMLEEARRLWRAVGRENLMIGVPATPECIAAVELLIGEGINVNVTLVFALEAYERVAVAYLCGLERLARRGGDLAKVASVASFSIRPIDDAVDAWIAGRLKENLSDAVLANLRSLLGKVACASARSAHLKQTEVFRGERWLELDRKGAHQQRLLWTGTSTKTTDDGDLRYAEALIGADTITALTPATFEAFRDHGKTRSTLSENTEEAISILDLVVQAGIPLQELTDALLTASVTQFAHASERMLRSMERRASGPDRDTMGSLEVRLLRELYDGRPHS